MKNGLYKDIKKYKNRTEKNYLKKKNLNPILKNFSKNFLENYEKIKKKTFKIEKNVNFFLNLQNF